MHWMDLFYPPFCIKHHLDDGDFSLTVVGVCPNQTSRRKTLELCNAAINRMARGINHFCTEEKQFFFHRFAGLNNGLLLLFAFDTKAQKGFLCVHLGMCAYGYVCVCLCM